MNPILQNNLQIVLTGQPELRDVLNNPDLRQLKQRVALRCVIKPLPNVEETDRYITSRLLVAGAERTDIFRRARSTTSSVVRKVFPATSTIFATTPYWLVTQPEKPRSDRSIIEDIAETFDMLPRSDRGLQAGEERESAARIFSSAGRAELWSAGKAAAEKEAENAPPVPVE